MKNNTAYFFVFMFWVFSVNAQSKKEQIENLNYQIDSLNQVLLKEQKLNTNSTFEISQLNAELTRLNASISSLNAEVSKLTSSLKSNQEELFKLQAQLKVKSDSLLLVQKELVNVNLQLIDKKDSLLILQNEYFQSKNGFEELDILKSEYDLKDTTKITEFFEAEDWSFDDPLTIQRALSQEFIGCDCRNEINEQVDEVQLNKLQYKSSGTNSGKLTDLSIGTSLVGTSAQIFYNGAPFNGRLISGFEYYTKDGTHIPSRRLTYKDGWPQGPYFEFNQEGTLSTIKCLKRQYGSASYGLDGPYGACAEWSLKNTERKLSLIYERNDFCERTYFWDGSINRIAIFVPIFNNGADYISFQEFELVYYNTPGNLYHKNDFKFIKDPLHPQAYICVQTFTDWNEELKEFEYQSVYNDSCEIVTIHKCKYCEKKVERYNKFGKLHGKQEVRNKDGKLIRIRNYQNGLRDGEQIDYFEDGSIEFREFYTLGSPSGIWEEYYENHNLKSKGERCGDYDCKTGVWIEYYENGNLKNKRNYVNGELSGPFEEFWENGQLRVAGEY